MQCRLCQHYYKSKWDECLVAKRIVCATSTICDKFILAEYFWCPTNHNWLKSAVCEDRVEVKRSCFKNCKVYKALKNWRKLTEKTGE